MDTIYIAVIGILSGIFVFGLKTGIGCGFSNIKKQNIILLAGVYFLISLVIGTSMDYIGISYLQSITDMGMTLHVLVALLLIGAGIYTRKKWYCGHDVSRHSFLAISLPCPVCLTALFISCTMLASSLGWSGLKIGVLTGVVFFTSILLSSWTFKRMDKTPETLGSVMMFLGIFYVLGAMIAPAYMEVKQMDLAPIAAGEFEIGPYLLFSVLILVGFILNHMKTKKFESEG